MTSDEIKERRQGVPADGALKQMVRDLSTDSQRGFAAARDRVLEELRATPPHLQTVRVPPLPSAAPRWRTPAWLAAAAAIVLAVATVRWAGNDVVYAGDAGRVLTLDDGSTVEMRAQSELSLEGADDGIGLRLLAGDIIVNAATQRNGSLYVRTSDMTVAVDGTVFLVKAAESGSLVAVIEGEVRVQDSKGETTLRSGEQMSSRSTPAAQVRPVIDEIAWSRRKDAYLALLQSAVAAAPPNQQVSTPPPAATVQPASTEFEEASIRECDPNGAPSGSRAVRGAGPGRFQMTPGRTSAECLTLATIIRMAYGGGLQDGPLRPAFGRPIVVVARGVGPDPRSFAGASAMSFDRAYLLGVEDGARVRGGPDWVRSALYTIEAVAAGAADAQAMRGPMLRTLLERRFGLKVHVETEQFPVPQLAVAPGGLKMKEGMCTKSDTPPPMPGKEPSQAAADQRVVAMVRRNLEAARRGAPISFCGMLVAMNGPNLVIVVAGFRAPEIDVVLSRLLDAPIVNRTGIPDTASFNFVLEFVPDDSLGREYLDQVASGDRQIAGDPSTVPRAPGIVAALEEQLGLRLERVRASRDFIVIDQVERPSPN